LSNLRWYVLAIIIVSLNACGGDGPLGLGKKESPDEFAVVSHSPLAVPPDYSLRPPRPGAERPGERAVRDVAADELFGKTKNIAVEPSAGEQAILTGANALNPDPNIREEIEKRFSIYEEDEEGFFQSIKFWEKESAEESIIDAGAEADRLRENEVLGKPPNEGQLEKTREAEKSLLEDLF
tara:strand:+ start:229 stop:771 length:543 start_codon:yes stop_codon:yes gene_type:complete